jgi:hypothetical protein
MQQHKDTKNTKIPKHLSIPLDLALPYHSIHIQETSILYPDNHKENSKRIYISDHSTIDKHVFNELFQQSEYSTQTHPKKQNKTQNKTQRKNKRKNQKKNPKSTLKNVFPK